MIHSILLIGQSNMAGRGFLEEAVPVDTTRLKVLRNGRWQGLYRPVNGDRPFSGVNLAESFAEAYAKKFDVDVGIIPCADGGTSLMQWQPGSLLFDHAVFQAKLAQRTSTIAAVLWHQGEADCADGLWQTYQARLEPILKALRAELDLYDVPFLLGGLGDYLKNYTAEDIRRNYPLVNSALQKTAADHPMTGYVSSENLGANPDNLHFNAKALHEFGLRYFAEFEKYRDPNKIFTEKCAMDDAIRTELEKL